MHQFLLFAMARKAKSELTCEEANMVYNEVQPESIGEGWPLGEVSQVGTNAGNKLPKQGFSTEH